MDFSNTNIPREQLPTIESAQFNPLEKDYLKVSRIAIAIFFCFILMITAVLFFIIDDLHSLMPMSIAGIVLLITTTISWIANTRSFHYSGYAYRQKDVLFKRGWLIRRIRVVPLKRIQHVSVQSGPIERKFGLASISIFTAGSESADFTIKGITETTAQQIKEWIFAGSEQHQ